MESLPIPDAVKVLIDWFILLIATIKTFFERLNGGDEEASGESTSANE